MNHAFQFHRSTAPNSSRQHTQFAITPQVVVAPAGHRGSDARPRLEKALRAEMAAPGTADEELADGFDMDAASACGAD